MEISFKNQKLKKVCEDKKKLVRKYGKQSEEIIQRINELSSAKDLYDIFKLPKARLHKLSGNWRRHFSVDLNHPYRLILLPLNGEMTDFESITKIRIIAIIDYH